MRKKRRPTDRATMLCRVTIAGNDVIRDGDGRRCVTDGAAVAIYHVTNWALEIILPQLRSCGDHGVC